MSTPEISRLRKSGKKDDLLRLPQPNSQDYHRVLNSFVNLNFTENEVLTRFPEYAHSLVLLLRGEVPRHCLWLNAELVDHVWRTLAQRDNGICSLCRLNTLHLQHAIAWYQAHWRPNQASIHEFKFALGHLAARWPRRLWDIDHIQPKSQGGAWWAVRNLRTLCLQCHWAETQRLIHGRVLDLVETKSMNAPSRGKHPSTAREQQYRLAVWASIKRKA